MSSPARESVCDLTRAMASGLAGKEVPSVEGVRTGPPAGSVNTHVFSILPLPSIPSTTTQGIADGPRLYGSIT